jgi:hypothetical protein
MLINFVYNYLFMVYHERMVKYVYSSKGAY